MREYFIVLSLRLNASYIPDLCISLTGHDVIHDETCPHAVLRHLFNRVFGLLFNMGRRLLLMNKVDWSARSPLNASFRHFIFGVKLDFTQIDWLH